MTHDFDLFEHLVDFLALCAGLVVIAWIGLRASFRKRALAWPPAAVIGMVAWLAAFGFALYLMVYG